MSLINSVPGLSAARPAQINPGDLPIGNAEKISKSGAAAGSEKAAGAGFGEMVDRFVSDVDTQMRSATTEQAKVLSGESTNLHQAMISMQEASVAFSLMVEVRNKLVESYQELMRMQI